MAKNIDAETVKGFGAEWSKFDQSTLSREELARCFDSYFKIFPWDKLPQQAVGFDLGCGSGRWAAFVAPKVGKLFCIDASSEALEVARRNLRSFKNTVFLNSSVDTIPLGKNAMDFAYSIGVLHHVPDTQAAISSCVELLKPGAPILLYLYYAFDNKPVWYRWIWRCSDFIRRIISRFCFRLRYIVSQIIAITVYYPLAKSSFLLEKLGADVGSFPLSAYRYASLYTMRTDALDRFGTRLEQRFTAKQIRRMMETSGLEKIAFSNQIPFWCAVGYKKQ